MTFLLQFIRLCSALLALCGVVALVLWSYFPETIDALDRSVIWRYRSAGLEEIAEAGRLIRTEPEESVAILAALAREMEAYKTDDVLFPRRRAWALLYSEALTRTGDDAGALRVLDAYAEEDPHDLPIALDAIRLLLARNDPEAQDKAQERARALFEWLPSVPSIARTYIDLLARTRQREATENALVQYLEFVDRPQGAAQNLRKGWEVFWSGDTRFQASARTASNADTASNRLQLSFSIPAGQTHIRLDPPPYSIMDLGDPILRIELESGSLDVPLTSHEKSSGVVRHALGLSVQGSLNPWIIFRLPDSVAGQAFEAHFIADLNLLPAWLRGYLAGPLSKTLAKRQAEAGNWRQAELIRRAWQNERVLRPLQLIGPEKTESAALEADGADLAFQVNWQPQGETTRLEIVLPARAGDILELGECTVRSTTGEHRLADSGEHSAFTLEGVRREGGRWVVLERGPRLIWRSETDGERVVEWSLRGALQ